MKAVEAVPEPSTFLLAVVGAAAFLLRKRVMKILLLIAVLAIAATAYAGEGGTGLQSPEPSTIGLLGAAVLIGVPAWYLRRRKRRAEVKDEAE